MWSIDRGSISENDAPSNLLPVQEQIEGGFDRLTRDHVSDVVGRVVVIVVVVVIGVQQLTMALVELHNHMISIFRGWSIKRPRSDYNDSLSIRF